MNSTFSLFKIIFLNHFSFNSFFADFKKGPKFVFKNILILIASLFTIFYFASSFAVSIYYLNITLEAQNKTNYLPIITTLYASFFVMIFALISVAVTYYNGYEELFLTLPISGKNLLQAKVLCTLLMESGFGIIFVLISAFFYGIKNHLFLSLKFYLAEFALLCFTLISSVFIVYFFFIILLALFKAFRKYNVLVMISTIFSITIILIINFNQNIFMRLINLIDKSFILKFFGNNLFERYSVILLLFAFCSLLAFILFSFLSTLYLNTLHNFNSSNSKKLSTQQSINTIQKSKHKNLFNLLFLRDIKNVLREPAFFVNGPLIIVIMLIFTSVSLIIAVGSGNNLASIKFSISKYFLSLSFTQMDQLKYRCATVICAVAVFAGSINSIAITSISREGKNFSFLKSLPLDFSILLKAKFWHAILYVAFSFIIYGTVGILVLKFLHFPFMKFEIIQIILMAFLQSFIISYIVLILEFFVDTYFPYFEWETPTQVAKGMNNLFCFLICLVILTIFIAVFFNIHKFNQFVYRIIGFGFCALIIRILYFKFAPNKLNNTQVSD